MPFLSPPFAFAAPSPTGVMFTHVPVDSIRVFVESNGAEVERGIGIASKVFVVPPFTRQVVLSSNVPLTFSTQAGAASGFPFAPPGYSESTVVADLTLVGPSGMRSNQEQTLFDAHAVLWPENSGNHTTNVVLAVTLAFSPVPAARSFLATFTLTGFTQAVGVASASAFGLATLTPTALFVEAH